MGFKYLLFWLEEHYIGILTTIAIHLFIITLVLVLKIRTYTEREYQIMIDVSQIETEMEKEEEQETVQTSQEMIRSLRQEYNIRSIPVNTAENRAVENIDQMVRDIKTEMNITDPAPQQNEAEEVRQDNDMPLKNEAQIYEDKYPLNNKGERTVYKGPTTVSYELSGRRHAWMPVPAYKCQGRGKIVVDIAVNQRGYVLSADINKSKSDSQDPCLIEAAKRDALRSRFNESSLEKQQGSITYVFMAQ